MRVVLVAPPMDFLHGLYGFRDRRAYRNQLPLGLGYLAAVLRREGIGVHLLDAAAHGWDLATTVERVLAAQPDLVGVSAITMEAAAAYDLVKALRSRTRAALVLGGAHATSFVDEVPTDCPELDAVVAGEGEQTLLEICQALQAGRPLDGIAGLRARRADGSFGPFVERLPPQDLDALPPPAFDLYQHELYRPLPHRRRRLPASSLITSRGCSWGRCTYCEMSAMSRRGYRRHSPARVVRDMKQLVSVSGAREIYFQDDIFITEPEWVEELCELLRREKLDVAWSCESRFDGVSFELLKRMREAGCWRIYFGLESGDARLLRRIKKGFTPDQAREAVRRASAAGLEVVGFFMLGLPGETPETGRRTIEFSLGLGLDHAIYSLTVPNPGTELHDICSREGKLTPGRSYFAKRARYVPEGYASEAQLEQLRAEAFRRFYLRPSYWLQCARKIRSLDDVRYYADGVAGLLRFLD